MLIVHKKNLIGFNKKAIGFAKNHSPKALFALKSAIFPTQPTKTDPQHTKNKLVFYLDVVKKKLISHDLQVGEMKTTENRALAQNTCTPNLG